MIIFYICLAIYLLGMLPTWAYAKRIDGINNRTRVIGTIIWPLMLIVSRLQ